MFDAPIDRIGIQNQFSSIALFAFIALIITTPLLPSHRPLHPYLSYLSYLSLSLSLSLSHMLYLTCSPHLCIIIAPRRYCLFDIQANAALSALSCSPLCPRHSTTRRYCHHSCINCINSLVNSLSNTLHHNFHVAALYHPLVAFPIFVNVTRRLLASAYSCINIPSLITTSLFHSFLLPHYRAQALVHISKCPIILTYPLHHRHMSLTYQPAL